MDVRTFFRRFKASHDYELIFGFTRFAIPLSPEHRELVDRIRALLASHLAGNREGVVVAGSLDLVLDDEDDIVLHPPLVVLLGDNRKLLRTPTRV